MTGEFETLLVEARGPIAVVTLNRPQKRNAVNDVMIAELDKVFSSPPDRTKAIVLAGAGEHFCAGLDLSEHSHREAVAVMKHSQRWHATFDKIQFGGLPVIAALHGAVIGGGLELALATHVRVADTSTFYGLPEGRRGIFVGGGGSVRVARTIGQGRMVEMMLTGRNYESEEGLALGLSHYRVDRGGALDRALALAETVVANAPLSNYMILNAIARIDEMAPREGLFTESLAAALAQTSPEAKAGMRAFLDAKKQKAKGDDGSE
ncbi:MAG: crotonase/enoyl-CoA hydratase family protein [Pseudomonadota bacterium]